MGRGGAWRCTSLTAAGATCDAAVPIQCHRSGSAPLLHKVCRALTKGFLHAKTQTIGTCAFRPVMRAGLPQTGVTEYSLYCIACTSLHSSFAVGKKASPNVVMRLQSKLCTVARFGIKGINQCFHEAIIQASMQPHMSSQEMQCRAWRCSPSGLASDLVWRAEGRVCLTC